MKLRSDISEENKQAFQKQMDDLDRQSEARSNTMRQVSPWQTAGGGSVKLPTQYGIAWEGANGEIIMNDDPLYNPNSDPQRNYTTWTRMEQVQR
jgi:hypothetical protein